MFGEVGVGVTDERERLLVDDMPVEDVHLVLSHRLLQQNTSRRQHEQLASRQAGVDTSRYQLRNHNRNHFKPHSYICGYTDGHTNGHGLVYEISCHAS